MSPPTVSTNPMAERRQFTDACARGRTGCSRGRVHPAAPVRRGLGDDVPRRAGRAGLADHVRDQHVPVQFLERPVRRAGRAQPSALRGRGRAVHARSWRAGCWPSSRAMAEVAGRARGGDGHRSGCAGRDAGHADLDVPGGRPRLRRARRSSASWSPCASSPAAAGRAAVGTRIESPWLKPLRLGRPRSGVRPRSCWEAGCGILGRRQALAAHAFLRLRCLGQLPFSGVHGRACTDGRWARLVPSARARAAGDSSGRRWVSARSSTLLPFDGTPRTVTFYQAVTRTAHQTSGALAARSGGRLQPAVFSPRGGRVVSCPAGEDLRCRFMMPSRSSHSSGRPWLEIDGVGRTTRSGGLGARGSLVCGGEPRCGVPFAHQAAAGAPGAGDGGSRVLPGRPLGVSSG